MYEVKTYEGMDYCGHCDEDTMQTIHESGHERDMSNDWRECHKCKWRWDGYSGEWKPPYEDEETKRN